MMRRCEPLYDGDTSEVCGALFDDAKRMAVCPHVSLAGGDTLGLSADPQYLRARAKPDARAPLPARLRHLGLVSDVPSNAPEPPLPQLGSFDSTGHLQDCTRRSLNVTSWMPDNPELHASGDWWEPCDCPSLLRRVAEVWAQAYKSKPPTMLLADVQSPWQLLGPLVKREGVVAAVVHLLREYVPDDTAVAVLHQAAEQLRPPADPDQRTFAQRLRAAMRASSPVAACTCARHRNTAGGGEWRDPGCPLHGDPPVRPPTGL